MPWACCRPDLTGGTMYFPRLSSRHVLRAAAGAAVALSVVASAMAANADGKSPATAMPLSGIATGSLTGSTAGAYDYFTFNYPGDGSIATISFSVTPNDPVTMSSFGVNVYQGSTLLASNNAG